MGGQRKDGKGQTGKSVSPRPPGKSHKKATIHEAGEARGAPPALPAWLQEGVRQERGSLLPTGTEPLLIAVIIGEAAHVPWFSSLSNGSRIALLASLERVVRNASPGAPLFVATPGGYLSQPVAGGSHTEVAAPLAALLGPNTTAFVGVDGPWAPYCDEQSIVPVTSAGAQVERWKLYPAEIGGGQREGVPHAARSYRFDNRVVSTGVGQAWPAVCHDLNAVPGVARAYDAWTGATEPSRAQLEDQLPRSVDRPVSVIVNAVHQFKARSAGGGGFGRFPGRTSAAAAAASCATLSAAKLVGYEDSRWSAARHAHTAQVVAADSHWWVEGTAPSEWVWMQIFRASSLGL